MNKSLLALALVSAFASQAFANSPTTTISAATMWSVAKQGNDDVNVDDRGRNSGNPGVSQLARHGADDGADDRGAKGMQLARHGADDPAGDDRGAKGMQLAKHGADDPAGDDRGAKGMQLAKHGADDAAGDDSGRAGCIPVLG